MRTVILALFAVAPFAAGCAHHSKQAQVRSVPAAAEVTPAVVAHEDAVAASAQPCGTVYAHFELDSAAIQSIDKPALEGAAACLRNDRDTRITIEGNTDERGTEEYNIALGERRATVVARHMESLGASPAQIRTVSFGESRPECHEHTEGCWAKNRRATIGPDKRARATATREQTGTSS
jgi:peptidoglycan-associated lipoprotein